MKENKNRGYFIIIGVLSAIILALVLYIAVTAVMGKADSGQETGEPGTVTDEPEDIFEKELPESVEENNTGEVTFVMDGFQMRVPSDYECFYYEGIGPVIYMEDVFQMKIVVRDGSYEEEMKNPESITEKSVEAGGEILQEVRETELDGKKYVYFRVDLLGDENFVVQTQAADTDRRLGGQIVVEKQDLTDEDLLHIFAGVACTAQVTDAPDSGMEDILGQTSSAFYSGVERKEESTITYAGESVSFKVPEGFYSEGVADTELYGSESFVTENYSIMADCFLEAAEPEYGAKEFVENNLEYADDSVKEGVELKTLEAGGKTWYYCELHYKHDGSDMQRIYAACDISDSAYFSVKVIAIDAEQELTLDMVRAFFEVK